MTAPQLLSGSSVTYNGGATYTVKPWSYQSLVINGTGTFKQAGTTTYAENFAVNNGTYTTQSFNLTVSTNFTQSSGLIQLGTSVVSSNGNLIRTGGTFDAGSSTIQFTGSTPASLTAGGTNFANVIINKSGGSLALTDNLFVTGNWTASTPLSAGNSTVTFSGAGIQKLSGATTFYALRDITSGATLQFTVGTTNYVTSIVEFRNIGLQSTGASGTTWYFSYTGSSQTLTNLRVRDSNASPNGGLVMNASDGTSTNLGNNKNWNFTAPDTGIRYWVASAAGNWSNASNWSTSSGGPASGGVPLSSHTVVFDGGSVQVSSVNVAFAGTVASMTVTSAYTGSIYLSTNFVVTTDLTISSGTIYTAKDAVSTITVGGMFYVGPSATVIIRRSSTSGNGAGQTITASSMTINGTINADGKGFDLGSGPGYSSGSPGGTYGGVGVENPLTTYGSATSPTSLGSGGANSGGGGAITLSITNTATINGVLSANGPPANSGDGSGGSINILAGTLLGGGTIQANGYYDSSGYGGGGGRISLNGVGASSFNGTIQASGFQGSSHAGTILLPPSQMGASGDLILGGAGNMSALRLGNDVSYTFRSLTINGGGLLELDGNPNNGGTCNGSNCGTGGTLIISTLTLNGGVLSADDLGFNNSISIGTQSGPGNSGTSNIPAIYGGLASGTKVLPYGSLTNPTALGSGAYNNGGGAITLVVANTFTNNGTVTASDAMNTGSDTRGTGSGGSINITAGVLTGTGTIKANGGNAYSGATPNSSGGRVAVKLTSGNSTGAVVIQALGGTTGSVGAAGTVYVQRAAGWSKQRATHHRQQQCRDDRHKR